jgi:hypothetical protein
MKKLFVSVPMKGRTEEEIKESINKMHRIAEAYEGEELELMLTLIAEAPPAGCNRSVWYLSKSIEKLAEADIFIGIRDTAGWAGCRIEADVAKAYKIKSYRVDNDIILDASKMLTYAIANLMDTYDTNDDLRSAQTR